MKVRRLLLFPVLCGMFLSSCGESTPVVPDNVVIYTFEGLTEENYAQKLTKGGTKVYVEPYVTESSFEKLFQK